MKSKFTRVILGMIAVGGMVTNFATAQDLGGIAGRIHGGAGNAAANSQVQQQIQAQVQQQVQQQVHAQVQSQMQNQLQAQVQGQLSSQAQMHADAARAGIMAQNAIDNARQNAVGDRGVNAEGTLGARFDANVQSQSQNSQQQNGLSFRSDANMNSSFNRLEMNLPPGFAEADVKVYDAVFGNFNPFRGNVEHSSAGEANANANERISAGWQSSEQGVLRASANSEMDLAVRIDSAVHQRRSEISLMRDRALDASSEAMMEQAEQMEKVLDLFIEARARAATETRSRSDVEGNSGRNLPNGPNPNSAQFNAEQNSGIQNSSRATFGNGGR